MYNPVADFIAFRREIKARSPLIDLWGFMLNVPTLVGGLVFISRPAGVAVVAAILVSLLIALEINKRAPMSRLMALCHVVYLPALYVMARDLSPADLPSPFQIWLTYSLSLMSLCVFIDLFDLYRYFAQGNRTYGKTPQA